MKNWKTTVSGAIGVLIALAGYMHWLSPELCSALITLATAIGLYHAPDKANPAA